MSAAAYSEDPAKCINNVFKRGYFHKRYAPLCDSWNNTCTGFSAVSHDDEAIILSFCGTTTSSQLVTEGFGCLADAFVNFPPGGQACSYFLLGYKAIWDSAGMKSDLLNLSKEHPTYKLWVTGHSLGGAMASLAAATVVHEGLYAADRVSGVSFGQPRVGDEAFAKAHSILLPNFYRVVHKWDLVTKVPRWYYFHHKTEIWYDNDMATGEPYQVCSDPEGNVCASPPEVPEESPSWDFHRYYFDVMVSQFGIDGCPRN